MTTPQATTRKPAGRDGVTRRVAAHVTRRFPEMRGITPSTTAGHAAGQTVYTFRTQVEMGAGHMTYIVRVVVDEHGRILRTISSH